MTFFPNFLKAILKDIPVGWRARHALIFYWLVIMQIVSPGKKTLKEQSRWAPGFITEWRYRRLLKSSYWCIHLIISYLSKKLMELLPPPKDGVIFLVADGSKKNKTGKKGPVNQKGKIKSDGVWFFGIKFVLLLACWNSYKIPVAFRLVRKKVDESYQSENEIFRLLLGLFEVPTWAKRVIVLGDSAFASKDNMNAIMARNTMDKGVKWNFVFAFAKTWKTEDGQALRDIVRHMPRSLFQKIWLEGNNKRRKYFWYFMRTIQLRHVGEVTMILSKRGRNLGPKATKVIVTNLEQDVEVRDVINIYRRRWNVEIVFKELKSGLGLGEHQVSKEVERVEKSVGISVVAYLFLLLFFGMTKRGFKQESIFVHQNEFKILMIKNQMTRSIENEQRKLKKVLNV